MTTEIIPAKNDHVISVHEIGHLIVGCLLGRHLEKATIDFHEGQRGCFWAHNSKDMDDHIEYMCLIAGPKSQVLFCPDSLPHDKIKVFNRRIIQPTPLPHQIPEIYDLTGWQYDIRPVYKYLFYPSFPVDRSRSSQTHRQLIDHIETALTAFFCEAPVRAAVENIANELEKYRLLTGDAAMKLVRSTGLSQNPTVMGHLIRP